MWKKENIYTALRNGEMLKKEHKILIEQGEQIWETCCKS